MRPFALFVVAALSAGCRCKGDTKIGEKRAFACAEVPSRDTHEEVDLGEGKRLMRDGVRASIKGVPDDAAVAVTSFEGGAGEPTIPSNLAALFVVGLGRLPREPLAQALSSLAKKSPLVVAVAGPEDEVDLVRAAIADAGKRVIDGGVIRAFSLGGLEVVTIPGSDDPSTIAEHGRGCVVRAEDVRALSQKLGPHPANRPRVALVYAAPGRDPGNPRANDALAEVSAWLVGGPLDRDGAVELALPPGAPAPLLPIPRAVAPRTTSTPGLIPPGFVLLKAEAGIVQLKRIG